MKKLIIAGGSGFLGKSLIKYFEKKFDEIIVLVRSPRENSNGIKFILWDAEHQGEWNQYLENADLIINLCGKSVDCRYTKKNKSEIFSSRLNSTHAIGTAIANCKNPPALWMNAASATIYRYSEDKQMTEALGETGKGFSVEVCKAWEKTFNSYNLPHTRKINLRITMVMGKDGGVFPVLKKLVKRGLGGKMGSGDQFVSWIHVNDFCRIIEWLINDPKASGNYNVAAPVPITNKNFMQMFRTANQIKFGLPATKWMLEIGAFFLRTETELVLKSRNVVPDRILKEGFKFEFSDMESCIKNLNN